jgi:predicted nuclease of restriction endonuclease-like (RecB) superfamily
MKKTNSFGNLVASIRDIDAKLALQASRAVNVSLTIRNWLIGFYIEEYERNGIDRAKYGENLIDKLSQTLIKNGLSRCDRRELYRYRIFYKIYPQIVESVTPQFISGLTGGLASDFPIALKKIMKKGAIVESVTPQSKNDGKTLIKVLSFTHIAELLNIEDDTKRLFYETECIKGNWSVRELKRQINSFYYERMGLSRNKNKLSVMANAKAETTEPKLDVRDPYIFEFLGLKPKEVMAESRLEDGLLDKLQEFLLEMGHGFCFEARQKKILIGESNYFIDLVFYHRVLKCHVLVELKTGIFSHENVGQINTYVSWYKKNMMEKGDNPPVGILLCANKDQALVEYALAGMANKLFVSKYQLELPKKEEIQKYITKQIMNSGCIIRKQKIWRDYGKNRNGSSNC